MRRVLSCFVIGSAMLLVGAAPGGGEQVHRPGLSVPHNPPVPRGLRGFQGVEPQAPPPAHLAQRPLVQGSLAETRGLAAFAAASTAPTDAHACRIACAQPYYFCLAGQDSPVCPATWGECVAACDAPQRSVGAIEPVTGGAAQPAAR